MDIRCIAVDMDGTLLNSKRICTERTRKALKAAHDKGIFVTLATGRIYGQAVTFMKEMGFTAPIISSNGAVVRNDDTVYHIDLLPTEHLAWAQKVAREMDTNYFFFGDNYIYYQKDNQAHALFKKWGMETLLPDGSKLLVGYDTHEEVLAAVDGHGVKALIYEADLEKNARIRAALAENTSIRVVNSEPTNLDVGNPWVNKGIGVGPLAKALGILPQQIMGVGDGENDYELLKESGFAVAMGNSVPILKEIADYVAPSNDEDGLAVAIEKFVL